MDLEPDTSKETIGTRLQRVREAHGWSQQMIAEFLGMSPQRWFNYESGKTLPPPDVLAKLWQVSGATSDFVLFGRHDGLPYQLAQRLLHPKSEAAPPPRKAKVTRRK